MASPSLLSSSSSKEVYLSYSRQEELEPFVKKLKHDLEGKGLSVWLDIEDTAEGNSNPQQQKSAVHSCGCLIAVLSNCYVVSKYSTSELYVADADNKPIIPVVYELVNYQQSQKAMGVKYVIGGAESVSFIEGVDSYSISLDQLITIVKQLVAQKQDQLKEEQSQQQDLKLTLQMSELRLKSDDSVLAPFISSPEGNGQTPGQDVADNLLQDSTIDGNPFHAGMKLEAVDRRFPYYVCVATIADVKGDEVKIHFDGWGPEYDYWCSYDMVELRPVGWCARNKYELQKPRNTPFANWNKYLSDNQAEACDGPMFNEMQNSPKGSLDFRVGMKLEAKDRKNPGLICVASIIDINDKNQLLIHFDGWSEKYDYWCEPDTTDIHPPMWCGKNGMKLEPPYGFHGAFKWSQYLADPAKNPAPFIIFTEEQLAAR